MKTASFRCYDGPGRISIARSARGVAGGYKRYPALAPGPWFNKVSKAEYEKLYFEQLFKLDASQVWRDLHALVAPEEPVLLCWEAPPFTEDNWCHRRMVVTWLQQEIGVDVAEMPGTPLPAKPRSESPKKSHDYAAARQYPGEMPFAVARPSEPIPDAEHRCVASSSASGRWYTVCNHGGQLYCDCPAFIFCAAPKRCKHLHGLSAAGIKPPAQGTDDIPF